ncbi:MFS transporter [Nocardia stercoris]|uniref:MFS transporter n=1 Tax=Nocardia stercoris TaxID=2483361 RepID=A0A3M2KRP0_9NOCA|nr:MFS transporter [Nocardia stercoris]RMI28129.1 MFS transporter [Nocardia stercoris]
MTSGTAAQRAATTTPTRFGVVFALVAAGVAMANLDLFVVNVAVPDIARHVPGANLSNTSWVLNGYTVVFAGMLVPMGTLADRIGARRAYLAGVAVFTLASLACAMAPNLWLLVAARVVQAVGSALLTPSSLGLLLAAAAPQQRPAAIRNWAALSALAAAVGPAIGGALTEIDWRWIFVINIPVGICVVGFGLLALRPSPRGAAGGRIDLLGSALLIAGCVGVVLALVRGNPWGWLSFPVLALLITSAALLSLAVVRADRHDHPALPIELFRLPGMPGALVANALFAVAFGAMLLAIPLWCQQSWGWSAMRTGFAFAPGPLMVPVLTRPAGALVQRLGPGRTAALGATIFAAGALWWIVAVDQRPDYTTLLPGLLLTGVGVCLVLPTLIGYGLHAVPPQNFSAGSALITMVRQAGLVIGVAGLIAVTDGDLHTFTRSGEFVLGAALVSLAGCLPIALKRGPRT